MIKFNEQTREISGETGYLKSIKTGEVFKANKIFLSIFINSNDIVESNEEEYLKFMEEEDKKYGYRS